MVYIKILNPVILNNQPCLFNLWSLFSLLFFFPSLFLIFLGFVTLNPGPALASTTCFRAGQMSIQAQNGDKTSSTCSNWTSLTWFQFFFEPLGNFFHLFTSSTQALHMSPTRSSDSLKDRIRAYKCNQHNYWGGATGSIITTTFFIYPKQSLNVSS